MQSSKLTKSEWTEIERKINPEELEILKFIKRAYSEPSLVTNALPTLAQHLKIDSGGGMNDEYLYEYLLTKKIPKGTKGATAIRLENAVLPDKLYEKILLAACEELKKTKAKHVPYWKVTCLLKLHVDRPNLTLQRAAAKLLQETDMPPAHLVAGFDEMEAALYPDLKLYSHQRALFESPPGLILLTAATGLGKTMSPIGFAQNKRIVFVCGARHVCLALAQKLISAGVGVAFAFGCTSPQDVRIHFAAAKKYDRGKNGAMYNVDNSDGRGVQVTISDLGSALHVFRWWREQPHLEYDPKEFVLYWDEPTIGMDAPQHALHEPARRMWADNDIPFIVLSSATLPDASALRPMFANYEKRFGLPVRQIVSSGEEGGNVKVLDTNNVVIMPHHYCAAPSDLEEIPRFILTHPAVLRYVDLGSAVHALRENPGVWESEFPSVDDVSAANIKRAYLKAIPLLRSRYRNKLYDSTIDFMGVDAQTITGPSIFLAEDVAHIARFCAQKIPPSIISNLEEKLVENDAVREQLDVLRKLFEDSTSTEKECDRKNAAQRMSPTSKALLEKMEALRFHTIELPSRYVPNSAEHMALHKAGSAAFTSNVDPETAKRILDTGVEPMWKILLLAGVGVFFSGAPSEYSEIVKSLAAQERLFMIIADTDYIYGTNYPFVHAYIAKDLKDMTQQKLIQALGRVGRFRADRKSNVRLRDNSFGKKLFSPDKDMFEAKIMNELFS